MKYVITIASISLLLAGCGKFASDSVDSAKPNATTDNSKWSWLPKAPQNDAEAATIPSGSDPSYELLKEDPLGFKGITKLTSSFGSYPADRTSFSITGGTLATTVGGVSRKAKMRDWDYLYEDAAFLKSTIEWGPCATDGELLLPRSAFENTPTDRYASNYFAAEAFGDRFVLVKLDPAKGHRLLIQGLGSGEGANFTAGYIGSKVQVGNRVLERKADGWYQGKKKVSD